MGCRIEKLLTIPPPVCRLSEKYVNLDVSQSHSLHLYIKIRCEYGLEENGTQYRIRAEYLLRASKFMDMYSKAVVFNLGYAYTWRQAKSSYLNHNKTQEPLQPFGPVFQGGFHIYFQMSALSSVIILIFSPFP
jgi:hypothetical protein